uniref:Uncharacterized protein n=1 Tax=Anguilla anguilla TaxID=7936 RepID=A0A0E9UFA7_ANGAN
MICVFFGGCKLLIYWPDTTGCTVSSAAGQ